jgi:hypothetical protein
VKWLCGWHRCLLPTFGATLTTSHVWQFQPVVLIIQIFHSVPKAFALPGPSKLAVIQGACDYDYAGRRKPLEDLRQIHNRRTGTPESASR